IPVQGQLLQHHALHGASAATQIVQAHAGEPCDEAVEAGPADSLQSAALPRPPPTLHDVLGFQRCNELADVFRVDLVICGQRQDDIAGGSLGARHDGGGFAETAAQNNHQDIARTRVDQGFHFRDGVPVRAIHDEDELVGYAHTVQAAAVFVVQLAQAFVAPADRNDYRNPIEFAFSH